jgi:hypothetical protein
VDPDPHADPDPAIFVIDLQEANKFFCLLLFEGTRYIYIIFQRCPKEVTKQEKSRFFLLFFLDDRRIRIREAQKRVNPVDPDPDSDPDPEHCFSLYLGVRNPVIILDLY